MFTPTSGRFPIWQKYFSDGLVQPPTRLDSTVHPFITDLFNVGDLGSGFGPLGFITMFAPTIWGHSKNMWFPITYKQKSKVLGTFIAHENWYLCCMLVNIDKLGFHEMFLQQTMHQLQEKYDHLRSVFFFSTWWGTFDIFTWLYWFTYIYVCLFLYVYICIYQCI